MTNEEEILTAGIDTHSDTHHVAVINQYGKRVADKEFLAVASGYQKIIEFVQQFGPLAAPVNDDDVLLAIRHAWRELRLVVEPGGAIALAAVLRDPAHFTGRRVGIVVSGGNVDDSLYVRALSDAQRMVASELVAALRQCPRTV